MTKWDRLKLGKVLSKSSLLEAPIPGTPYKQIGVQLWGRGAYEREIIDGGNTGYKYFNRVKTNDVVINKIWARNGAVSVVPESMDNHYVSTEFPVFHIEQNILHPKWMLYVSQQKWFWEACNEKAFGTSGKNRIKPEIFLEIEIPTPPLSVQIELISKIDRIDRNLERIKQLRIQETKDIKNLLYSKYIEIIEVADWLDMELVAPIYRRPVKIELNETYRELGTRSFFKGVFEKESFKGSDLTWEKPHLMKAGDFVFSNIKAWEGSVALISEKHDGWVASHRYITCLPNYEIIKPEFLLYFFSTPDGMDILGNVSPGSADRNRTLNTKKLMQAKVPVPDLALQAEFVDLAHKIEALHDHHAQIDKELNELMPSLLDKAFKGDL